MNFLGLSFTCMYQMYMHYQNRDLPSSPASLLIERKLRQQSTNTHQIADPSYNGESKGSLRLAIEASMRFICFVVTHLVESYSGDLMNFKGNYWFLTFSHWLSWHTYTAQQYTLTLDWILLILRFPSSWESVWMYSVFNCTWAICLLVFDFGSLGFISSIWRQEKVLWEVEFRDSKDPPPRNTFCPHVTRWIQFPLRRNVT